MLKNENKFSIYKLPINDPKDKECLKCFYCGKNFDGQILKSEKGFLCMSKNFSFFRRDKSDGI